MLTKIMSSTFMPDSSRFFPRTHALAQPVRTGSVSQPRTVDAWARSALS